MEHSEHENEQKQSGHVLLVFLDVRVYNINVILLDSLVGICIFRRSIVRQC